MVVYQLLRLHYLPQRIANYVYYYLLRTTITIASFNHSLRTITLRLS